MYYGDGKKKTAGLNELRDLDVLLTTPHMNMPEYLLANMKIHRLCVDEAHLLHGSTTASKFGALLQYQAPPPRGFHNQAKGPLLLPALSLLAHPDSSPAV